MNRGLKKLVFAAALLGTLGAWPAAGMAETGYVVTAADQALDCRKITGRMIVRLMQLRAELNDTRLSNDVAGVLQSATNPATRLMYGKSSSYLMDRPQRLQRDAAQMHAYNGLLTAKGCPAFDIAAELAKGPEAPQPQPVKLKKPRAK